MRKHRTPRGIIAIPAFFFLESDIGILVFVSGYLLTSVLAVFYFSKRGTLQDKSFNAVMLTFRADIKEFFRQVKEFFIALFHIAKVLAVITLIIWGFSGLFSGDEDIPSSAYQKGNMIDSGGSPSYRYNDTPSYYDDYSTTNDESNDQPVGFYGTDTMYACNGNSGNCYDLDVDSDGENVERMYFPKGGWVDIDYSDCDDGYCYVEDENGTEWELEY